MRALLKRLPYRWREMYWQLNAKQVTEVDILFFSQLEGCDDLVLDIGANRGQFALSLMLVNKSLRVLSFEANPELKTILSCVRLLHPKRFRFRLQGVGDKAYALPLHIPHCPDNDLSPNASLAPEEFDKDYVRERLTDYAKANDGAYSFRTRTAEIITIDSLSLKPMVVKIDVEGFEMPALEGMKNTLREHHPLLMIEMNNQHLFMPWLAQLGYQFFRFNADNKRLQPLEPNQWTLNVFCLHPQSPALRWIPYLSI